ncbi:helix-turn-helix domain-containing protein, partial [Bifidobacterium psychraerophilum]
MSRTPNPARDLGISIRDARKFMGWTQHELAKLAKVSRPTIARVETGGN